MPRLRRASQMLSSKTHVCFNDRGYYGHLLWACQEAFTLSPLRCELVTTGFARGASSFAVVAVGFPLVRRLAGRVGRFLALAGYGVPAAICRNLFAARSAIQPERSSSSRNRRVHPRKIIQNSLLTSVCLAGYIHAIDGTRRGWGPWGFLPGRWFLGSLLVVR
jgi:hypothetical protein